MFAVAKRLRLDCKQSLFCSEICHKAQEVCKLCGCQYAQLTACSSHIHTSCSLTEASARSVQYGSK